MEFFKISPTLSYQLLDNKMVLGKGTKQKIIFDTKLIEEILCFLQNLNEKIFSKKEIDFLLKKYSKINWNYLRKNDFLISSNFDINSTYSRNEMFWNYKFNNISLIKEKSDYVFVIWGCGGIGTSISFFLASMGFKNFFLIDKDIIERTNLNRQFLFSKENIGSKKSDVLKIELEKRFDNLSITKLDSNSKFFLSDLEEKLIGSKNLIILSADEGNCFSQATTISVSKQIPLLNVGYLNDISIIGPFCIPTDPKSSCLMCNSKIATNTSLSEMAFLPNKAPSWMGNNTQAVLIAIREIILYLKNEGNKKYLTSFNKRIGIDCLTLKKYSLDMPKNQNCKNHQYISTL